MQPAPMDPSAMQMGAAVQGGHYGVMPSPPADDADFEQRKGGFMQLFQSPQFRAALMQFGAQMMQPMSIMETPASHVANALTSGMAAGGRAQTEIEAEQQRQQELLLKQRGLDIQQQQADTSAEGVKVQREGVDVQRQGVEQQGEYQRGQLSNEGRRLGIEEQKADNDTQLMEAQIAKMEGDLEVARRNGASSEVIASSTQTLNQAKARYYDALAKNPTGSAATQEINLISTAFQKKFGLGKEEADLAAAQWAKTSAGKSEPDRVLEVMKVLSGTLAGMKMNPAELQAKAQEVVKGIGGLDITATPEVITGGDPSNMPPPGISAPPAVQNMLKASPGAQVIKQEPRTMKGGGQGIVYTIKLADGTTGYAVVDANGNLVTGKK